MFGSTSVGMREKPVVLVLKIMLICDHFSASDLVGRICDVCTW